MSENQKGVHELLRELKDQLDGVAAFDMTKLGFEQHQLDLFQDCIHQPYGMVLVTGPTGSGKTTTLYSALSELNQTTENLSTAEDPVEFNLTGINQVQMHDDSFSGSSSPSTPRLPACAVVPLRPEPHLPVRCSSPLRDG